MPSLKKVLGVFNEVNSEDSSWFHVYSAILVFFYWNGIALWVKSKNCYEFTKW